MEKRNTSKEKAKRNKDYPYKANRRIGLFINNLDTYQIVVKETGKVLEEFRLKTTAVNALKKWKEIYLIDVEVVRK